MKNTIKNLFRVLIKQLNLSKHRNTIGPSQWNAAVLNMIITMIVINAIFFGLIFFLGSTLIYAILTDHSMTEIVSVTQYIALIGVIFGSFGNFKSKETVTIEPGSAGIILFLGEIYGEEEEYRTTEGEFKVGLKLPFFGQLLSIVPQVTEYDNLDVFFEKVPTSDGQNMRGQLSVEIEVVNIYTIHKVNTATAEKGLAGRITEKTLELTNAAFGFHTIEEIILSGNTSDGISKVKEALCEQIKKRTGELQCFRKVRKRFDGSNSRGAECYFPEAGVNLKMNLIQQYPEDETLLDAYTNINVQQAEKEAAKSRAEITKIDAEAEAEAEALKITKKGFAANQVKKDDGVKQAEIIELTLEKLNDTELKNLSEEAKKEMILIAMGEQSKETKEYQVHDSEKIAAVIADSIASIFTKK